MINKEDLFERIEEEKSILSVGNDEEVKSYIIKKFEGIRELDLSDEVLILIKLKTKMKRLSVFWLMIN